MEDGWSIRVMEGYEEGDPQEFLLKVKKSAPRGEHLLIFSGRDALGRLRSVPVTVAIQ